MSYVKYDAKVAKVDDSARDINDAFRIEAQRRALQGIANRVLGGTDGVSNAVVTLAAGTTAGVKFTVPVDVLINGVKVAVAAQDNILLPTYTQAANTATKYLVSVGADGTAAVTGPGNVVSCADYSSNALGIVAAKLPDLPDGECAIGWFSVVAPYALEVVNNAGAYGGGGTQGTAAYQDLFCMPYSG